MNAQWNFVLCGSSCDGIDMSCRLDSVNVQGIPAAFTQVLLLVQ